MASNPYNNPNAVAGAGQKTYSKKATKAGTINPYNEYGASGAQDALAEQKQIQESDSRNYSAQKLATEIDKQKQQVEQQKTNQQTQAKKNVLQKISSAVTAPGRKLADVIYKPLEEQQNKAADQAVQQDLELGIPNTTPSEAASNTRAVQQDAKSKTDPREYPIVKPGILTAKAVVRAQTQPVQNRINERASAALDKAQKQLVSDYKAGKVSKEVYAETLRKISAGQSDIAKKTQEISQGPSPLEYGLAVADTGLNAVGLGVGGIAAKEFGEQAAEQGVKQAAKGQVGNLIKSLILNTTQGAASELGAEKPSVKGALVKGAENAAVGTAADIGLGGGGYAVSKGLSKLKRGSKELAQAEQDAVASQAERPKGALKPIKSSEVPAPETSGGAPKIEVNPEIPPVETAVATAERPAGALKPLTTIEQNTDKTSGVAKSIQAKAIEKKLTTSFKDLASFKGRNIKDQASRVASLITEDPERLNRLVDGEEALPEGLSGSMFIKGVEEHALANGDSELLRRLSKSGLVSDTSIHASEMRLLAEREPDSAVKHMKELAQSRVAAVERKFKKPVDQVVSDTTKEIKASVKTPSKMDWSMFVESIKC